VKKTSSSAVFSSVWTFQFPFDIDVQCGIFLNLKIIRFKLHKNLKIVFFKVWGLLDSLHSSHHFPHTSLCFEYNLLLQFLYACCTCSELQVLPKLGPTFDTGVHHGV